MKQSELLAVLSDLIAEQGKIDPEVRAWVVEHLSTMRIADSWAYQPGPMLWRRNQVGGSVVAVVRYVEYAEWRYSVSACGEACSGSGTRQECTLAADRQLEALGFQLIGGVPAGSEGEGEAPSLDRRVAGLRALARATDDLWRRD